METRNEVTAGLILPHTLAAMEYLSLLSGICGEERDELYSLLLVVV